MRVAFVLADSRTSRRRQKQQQPAHLSEIHRIDDGAAVPARVDQPRIRQHQKLGRHGIGGGLQLAGNVPGRHAARTGFHQRPEHGEPALMGQCGQLADGHI
jgi:hypothetical protein